MSIKKSLQSSILLLAVMPVILMALLAYIVATTKYSDINNKSTKNIASDYSYGFSSQLQSQIIETTALSENNAIKTLLLEKINSPEVLLNTSSNYYNNVKESLTQFSNSLGKHVNYYVYDIDGYLVASSLDDSEADWSEVMTTPVTSYHSVSIISNSHFTDNTIDIISPVIVKDEVIGLIRSNISIQYFGAFLSDKKDCFIIDDKGDCLFGYEILSDDDKLFLEHITGLLKNTIEANGASDDDTSSKINDAFTDSSKYVYGYALIPKYNWIYVVKTDTSSYTSIISTLPIVFLILLSIVVIFAILISKNLAVKYTQPIFELSEKMQNAADGQLNVHCQIDSDDEFGVLSTHFNHMMDIISANYNEISETRKELEANQIELQNNYQRIEKLAYSDALTGLYNRMAFFKFANEILSDKHGVNKKHAIIFIDLDGFKSINDTLGHDYGDLLLKAVADQLSTLINNDDILARNGGDEFVILRNQIPSREDLEAFLFKMVSIASHPFVLDDETVHITLSAGVALFPQNGLSLGELMKNADLAMYTSKISGKNSYTFFSSAMEDEVNRRTDLIDILRNAIDNKDVYLLYQPQADIATGEIIGCEALMRLNSPIIGFVSPDEFIPVAEECGLIDELGEWALLEACNFNQRLMDAGFKPLRISVNVSTAQLRGDRLIKAIEALPEKTSMPLKYLEIELTESVLMKNFEHNLALINRMKELDIQIALDDFGTGYSSFSYLTKIPINTLKIDKSFIAGICDNENDNYIAGTIINLAHQLGITVIAEGVETIEQLRILQQQMCDILQGYFFSRAISEEEFIELLKINS